MGVSSEKKGFEEGYRFSYIGKVSAVADSKMNFLRGMQVLTMLDGRAISKETLLEVIFLCNEAVTQKFQKGMREVEVFETKRVTQADLDYASVTLTCEDYRLSVQACGQKYMAINLGNREVDTIDSDELDDLLDIAAAAVDVEGSKPEGPAATRLKTNILDSDGFKRARNLLLSRL